MTATTNSTNGHLPNQPNGLPLKQELSAPAESGTLLSQTLRANLSGSRFNKSAKRARILSF